MVRDTVHLFASNCLLFMRAEVHGVCVYLRAKVEAEPMLQALNHREILFIRLTDEMIDRFGNFIWIVGILCFYCLRKTEHIRQKRIFEEYNFLFRNSFMKLQRAIHVYIFQWHILSTFFSRSLLFSSNENHYRQFVTTHKKNEWRSKTKNITHTHIYDQINRTAEYVRTFYIHNKQ